MKTKTPNALMGALSELPLRTGLPIGGMRVGVRKSMPDSAAEWQEFEDRAVGTLYQSFAWCDAWMATVGSDLGIIPVIVSGRNAAGELQFLLPMQIRRRFGVQLLEWLTMPHGNYGFGLIAPDFAEAAPQWFAQYVAAIWDALPKFDILHLTEMPDAWCGCPHPLGGHFNLHGANPSFLISLQTDYTALYERKRGKETRRSIRKRDTKLTSLGGLKFGLPTTAQQTTDTIDMMFQQQEGRLAENGIYGVFGPKERAFIHALTSRNSQGVGLLRPYTLWLDGRILSTILCAVNKDTCYAMITSLASGPERKYSPGDITLRGVISAACAEGFQQLDLSTGEWNYKLPWADKILPLRIILKAQRWRGLPMATMLASYYIFKRFIKQTPALKAALYFIRSLRGRKS
jgi:CelD/BcsL family acetyltransferase involved in cellulose biosynthesis